MHVRRRWLALAHIAWLVSAVLALLVFLAAIPLGYALRLNGAGFGVPIDAPAWYIAAISFAQGVVSMLAALVSLALAAILFWKKRDDPMTLFVSFYLLAHGIALAGPLEALNGFPPLFPGAPIQSGMFISADVILAVQTALFVPMLLLFYLFPNGRFIPGWTRYATLVALLFAPVFIYILAIEWIAVMTPLGWLVAGAYAVLLGAGMYAQIYRYRHAASPVERQQTKWVVFGLLLTFFVMAVLQIPYVIVSQIPASIAYPWWVPLAGLGWWLSLTVLPLSLAVAVMRYRLWDVDVILNRTLVYGSLTAGIAVIYMLLIVLLGALFQTSGNLFISLLATAAIALLFQPLRERLQQGVNRLTYGERDDPYAVISRLGQRLEATLAPDAVLPTIVETVAQALKLPYAAITLHGDEQPAVRIEYGSSALTVRPASDGMAQRSSLMSRPLVYQHEPLGELVVAPRVGEEKFSHADYRLLKTLADQASIAAHAARLTTDLQRSRERLVTSREEERRRIRRDLHDGLGPALAAQTLKVGSARAHYPRDPAKADALLAELERDIEAALADIRRLVYNLRPPALDELGLVGAIREQAAQYGTNVLRITLDAPPAFPPLPAAVEVAAYRIVQESLANVIRHAHARSCHIQLAVDGALSITVTDDGQGILRNHPAGIGLASMRERAAELGGSCVVEAASNGGTRVLARLPLEVRG